MHKDPEPLDSHQQLSPGEKLKKSIHSRAKSNPYHFFEANCIYLALKKDLV
jgi:hypothetical protein